MEGSLSISITWRLSVSEPFQKMMVFGGGSKCKMNYNYWLCGRANEHKVAAKTKIAQTKHYPTISEA